MMERKIVVGLDDVKAVILECVNCRTRVTITPDHARIPKECPDCQHSWLSPVHDNADFLTALSKMRSARASNAASASSGQANSPRFRILLEFDESEVAGRRS